MIYVQLNILLSLWNIGFLVVGKKLTVVKECVKEEPQPPVLKMTSPKVSTERCKFLECLKVLQSVLE